MSIRAQVDEKIAQVDARHSGALGELRGRWLQTDAVEAAIASVQSLRGPIDGWATRGRAAADSDKAPGAGGWDGWLKAGEQYLSGINEITGMATSETLGAIQATAENAARDAKTIAGKAANVAKRVVRETASTVGAAAGDVVRPAASALTIPLIVVGGFAAAMLLGKIPGLKR